MSEVERWPRPVNEETERCEICGNIWHGLPLTQLQLQRWGLAPNILTFEPDDSPVICPGEWQEKEGTA